MNKFRQFFIAFAVLAVTATSCKKEEDKVEETPIDLNKIAYVVNYGSYSGSKSQISIYSPEDATITNGVYNTANSLELTSNVETMAIHNDIAYFMSNNGDKIDIVDAKTMVASTNPISENIVKPRFFAATGSTGYISCWGGDDWGVLADSYIAKINLDTKALTKIAVPGGPEGVIIVGDKLYAALSTTNKVAVLDLNTEAVTHIEVSAVPQQFILDADNKLWVSLVSKYSTPFETSELGVAVINTTSNTVESTINYTGMGSEGFIAISDDKETVYLMGTEAWPGTAASINAVNVSDQTLNTTALITGENFNGFNVNPNNGDIYVLLSPSATEAGLLKVYDKTGTLVDEETAGVSPKRVVFYNYEK